MTLNINNLKLAVSKLKYNGKNRFLKENRNIDILDEIFYNFSGIKKIYDTSALIKTHI